MNDLSTAINKGEGGLKENPPCTPLKENKGRSYIFSEPVPVHIARTRVHAQGTPPTESTGTGTVKNDVQGTGTGTVKNEVQGTGTGTGTGTVSRRPKIDAELILHGYHENGRYDPVQTALYVFRLPLMSNGYNNAKLMRWHLRRLGEETFRQLMYDQWRENDVDGSPRNVAAAFMARCFKAEGEYAR